MAGMSVTNGERVTKDKRKGRMPDEENYMINPFIPCDTDELCHLASGTMASKKVQDLLTAYDKGKEAMATFISKRLKTTEVSSIIQYQN